MGWPVLGLHRKLRFFAFACKVLILCTIRTPTLLKPPIPPKMMRIRAWGTPPLPKPPIPPKNDRDFYGFTSVVWAVSVESAFLVLRFGYCPIAHSLTTWGGELLRFISNTNSSSAPSWSISQGSKPKMADSCRSLFSLTLVLPRSILP